MTQEEKDLLLKDLCARLFYGVKVNVIYSNENASSFRQRVCVKGDNELNTDIIWLYQRNEIDIKPYLFPLSSMTEEQQEEFDRIYADDMQVVANNLKNRLDGKPYETNLGHYRHIDWLNANHFDYRGLIPMGLAIDVTGLNIY